MIPGTDPEARQEKQFEQAKQEHNKALPFGTRGNIIIIAVEPKSELSRLSTSSENRSSACHPLGALQRRYALATKPA